MQWERPGARTVITGGHRAPQSWHRCFQSNSRSTSRYSHDQTFSSCSQANVLVLQSVLSPILHVLGFLSFAALSGGFPPNLCEIYEHMIRLRVWRVNKTPWIVSDLIRYWHVFKNSVKTRLRKTYFLVFCCKTNTFWDVYHEFTFQRAIMLGHIL